MQPGKFQPRRIFTQDVLDDLISSIKTKGVLIVGTYDVNGINVVANSGIQIGDKIIKVENNFISSISEKSSITAIFPSFLYPVE